MICVLLAECLPNRKDIVLYKRIQVTS